MVEEKTKLPSVMCIRRTLYESPKDCKQLNRPKTTLKAWDRPEQTINYRDLHVDEIQTNSLLFPLFKCRFTDFQLFPLLCAIAPSGMTITSLNSYGELRTSYRYAAYSRFFPSYWTIRNGGHPFRVPQPTVVRKYGWAKTSQSKCGRR